MDTRLIIRDTIVEKIKELDDLLGGLLFIETHSFLDWTTRMHLILNAPWFAAVENELGGKNLVLVKIQLIKNLSITTCIHAEEIVLVGYGHLYPLGSPSFVPYNDDAKRIFENVNRIRQHISLNHIKTANNFS